MGEPTALRWPPRSKKQSEPPGYWQPRMDTNSHESSDRGRAVPLTVCGESDWICVHSCPFVVKLFEPGRGSNVAPLHRSCCRSKMAAPRSSRRTRRAAGFLGSWGDGFRRRTRVASVPAMGHAREAVGCPFRLRVLCVLRGDNAQRTSNKPVDTNAAPRHRSPGR